MSELVMELAAHFHDEWRKLRLKSGTHHQPTAYYEPRIKDGNGGEVDIANTAYKNLPEKWQAENKAAAIAVLSIFKSEVLDMARNKTLDIEEMAAEVHVEWSKRNPTSSFAEIPYELLPEEEKEKDRAQVLAALNLLMRNP